MRLFLVAVISSIIVNELEGVSRLSVSVSVSVSSFTRSHCHFGSCVASVNKKKKKKRTLTSSAIKYVSEKHGKKKKDSFHLVQTEVFED